MADPTREQFDAASKKVMQSAPAGLSRDQFYALIDKELAAGSFHAPEGGVMGEAKRSMGETSDAPIHEPDTYAGGFVKGLKDYFAPTGIKLKAAMESAAEPKTVGDVAQLLLAADPVNVGKATGEFGGRSVAALKAAARDTQPGVASKATYPFRAMGKFNEALPSEAKAVSDEFMGRTGAQPVDVGSSTPGPVGPAKDYYSTYKANRFNPDFTRKPSWPPPVRASRPVVEDLGNAPSVSVEDLGTPEEGLSRIFGGEQGMGRTGAGTSPQPEPPATPGAPKQLGGSRYLADEEFHTGDTGEHSRGRSMHDYQGEMNRLYRLKMDDPLAALLMSIGGGAAALHQEQ